MSRWFNRVARSAAATVAAATLTFAPGALAQSDSGSGEPPPASQDSGSTAEPTNSLEGSGGEDNLLGPSTGDALSELESLTSGGAPDPSTSSSEDLGARSTTELGAESGGSGTGMTSTEGSGEATAGRGDTEADPFPSDEDPYAADRGAGSEGIVTDVDQSIDRATVNGSIEATNEAVGLTEEEAEEKEQREEVAKAREKAKAAAEKKQGKGADTDKPKAGATDSKTGSSDSSKGTTDASSKESSTDKDAAGTEDDGSTSSESPNLMD